MPESEEKAKSEEPVDEKKDEESEKPKEIKLSDEEKQEVLDIVDQILEQTPDVSEFAANPPLNPAPALRSLHISSWSPPTIQRKLRGDLFYLQSQTLEGETFHITAHVSGFFVNNSSITRFDGSMKTVATANGKSTKLSRSHSLLTLLKSLSPKFTEQTEKNGELLTQYLSETYSLPAATFLADPWLIKQESTPIPDLARSQELLLKGGLEGADLHKNYNDDFQSLRSLPKSNLPERMMREKILTKTSYDFTVSAIQGAMAIARGELTPMNPNEEPRQHIYLRNNIFYSIAIDASNIFEDAGGDEASRVCASKDINAINFLNRIDAKGVSHLR
ncbi:unnamed protein product [Ambrosiozyma monospora]|uniref:Unnamed protein product n=1 Tax=Ambrosiozyma monospora TaxID=43982 RepID=A0ACB5TYS4_AMBMO|nr:unnamed protein product [Ambrosiozyma monospora]